MRPLELTSLKRRIKEGSSSRNKGQVGGDTEHSVAIPSPLTTAAENKEEQAV